MKPALLIGLVVMVGCGQSDGLLGEMGGDGDEGADGSAGGDHDDSSGDGDGDTDVDGDGDGDMDGDGDGDMDGDRDGDGEEELPDEEPEPGPSEEPVCDTESEVVLYLSADDSNSMAGPTVARGIIRQGQIVYKGLRTYEFLNYYDFPYPRPADPDTLGLHIAMREDEPGVFALQIGVQAPELQIDGRRPVSLTIAVDSSSSMGWGPAHGTGIERARAACRAIAGSLRAGDVVSLITWGGDPVPLLSGLEVSGPDDPLLLTACLGLEPYGTTSFDEGLDAAYELATASFDQDSINRVVLISDGGANAGTTAAELIAARADDGDGEAIYLLGVGVGDPWNYNDQLMDLVTDAGRGAYVFLDSQEEAQRALGDGFLRHVEVAARDVQVELTLPPSFEMAEFHGEEYSENPEEVEPQHLAMNDAMVFHQVVSSCARETLDEGSQISVSATFFHPLTREARQVSVTTTLGELLGVDDPLLRKGDAIVAYAEALKTIRLLDGTEATAEIEQAMAAVDVAREALSDDQDLVEIAHLLETYGETFAAGPTDAYPTGGSGADPMSFDCGACDGTGTSLDAMRCAVELCDESIFLGQEYASPTGSHTAGSFEAVDRFGDSSNDLAPRVGASYALMGTGPATGRHHSEDMGGDSAEDPFSRHGDSMLNAMEWRLRLRAPEHANGLRIHHMFFSEEYDDFVGTEFNDKFYIVIEAGSTNGGRPTVINYTDCREPDMYHDFVCSPGMQFCNPRQRYCYVAINTALSECCWLDGCSEGTATTDISGTGFECASSSSTDSEDSGSTTGWMVTEWPVEPGETFELVFHIHDTGDAIFDSEVIIDGIQFLESVTPGTWKM